MLINKLHKTRSISSILAVLIFASQLLLISQSKDYSFTKLSETSLQIYYYNNDSSAVSNYQNSVKQNQERNYSSFNNYYDKNDLIAVADLTDSKRIYNGGFSASFRFKTFLTAIFSTST